MLPLNVTEMQNTSVEHTVLEHVLALPADLDGLNFFTLSV